MSRLQVMDEDGALLSDTQEPHAIASELVAIGVGFERWPLSDLPGNASAPAILAAYAPEIDRLTARGGYRSIDVATVTPDHPEREAMRGKFLSEHTHAEDEVRFFVRGEALFTLRADDRVWNVTCGAGDLIAVPGGVRHWFDMGAAPDFTAIRLFVNPDGWVARFTGDAIADRFPRYGPVGTSSAED